MVRACYGVRLSLPCHDQEILDLRNTRLERDELASKRFFMRTAH